MARASLLVAAVLALPGVACSQPGEPPPSFVSGPPAYAQHFDRAASPERFAAAYPGLATWGYFGAEPPARREGRTISQALRATSRAWPHTVNVNVDADYCPGARTPSVREGALHITAYRLAPADVATCGQGRPWASSHVSSQPSFSQTYGYFEARAKLPCDSGRWPAFWLIPTAKTPENGGRLAEIDVFEHYGGTITVTTKRGEPLVINRIGTPVSTLHSGTVTAEVKADNSHSLPQLTDVQRQAFCAAPHAFGVLWTPQEFRFYIDRRETFRTPNPGVSDPHYWVVNMDVSPVAGDPSLAPQPSDYVVYGVKAWRLP